MSSIVNKKENSLVEIAFDIPAEEFKGALNRAFKKNAKKFSIPGFRPGKAPMNIVTKYYGEGVLYDDAIEDIAQESYTKAIEEHNLEVVSKPEINEITEIGSDKGIKFTINVTVKPAVELGEYKGIKADKEEVKVTEEEVKAELDKVRDRNSRMVPVEDRTVLEGDTANIDYEGFVDGETFEGGQGTGYDLRIGSKTFIPGFEEQVIGRAIGDEFEVNVTFPEDYHAENLKGKDVVFKVKLNSIKVKELPEADDEFAKDVSEFDTLEEYKASLLEKLTNDRQKAADRVFEDNVINAVVENAKVEVPDVMIDAEVERTVQQQATTMQSQGIALEQYLQYTGQNMDQFKESLRDNAIKSVKTNLVLEAISKELNLEITEDDINEEIKEIASQYNLKEEDVKKQFAGDDSYFKESITIKKTVDVLKSEAKVASPSKKTEDKKAPAKKAPAKKATTKKDTDKKTTAKKTTKKEKTSEDKKS